MANRQPWWKRLFRQDTKTTSFLRNILSGSFYRVSDLKGSTSLSDIQNLIQAMRGLALDSQVATALAYYATDATLPNSSGQIIWATGIEDGPEDAPDIINSLFNRWDINNYVRDHILELATIGNLYIPTTDLYRETATSRTQIGVSLDTNSIPDDNFDIIPSSKLDPENVLHLYYRGEGQGYVLQPDEDDTHLMSQYQLCPESSIIHFSLGGLLGDYTIDAKGKGNDIITYDIKFAKPLMEAAIQPTQILNLLEDANVLASLIKVVKIVNVDCGNAVDEEEIRNALQQIKDSIEQQLSINTVNGDTQSFLNPQSPNNLIYVPKVNGAEAISITDLNITNTDENADAILTYYQDKKLSVLGIPKESLNFSAAEGLGNAGAVMSQRSALYANSLQRIETAYMSGWRDAINKYFLARNYPQFVDKFKLNMQPIVTAMDSVKFEQRDSSLSQAASIVDLLKSVNVQENDIYAAGIVEALSAAFPDLAGLMFKSGLDVTVEDEDEML